MKLLAILLVGVLLSQGAVAKPDPFFGEIAKGIANGIAGAAQTGGNIVAGIAEGWGKIAIGVVNSGQGIAESAIKASVNIVTGAANQWASLTGKVAGRFANIAETVEDAFKNVFNVGGNSFKKIGEEIKNQVAAIKEKVDGMMAEVETRFNEGLQKVNETLRDNKAKIEDWVSEIKEKYRNKDVSKEDAEKIEKLISEFVSQSSADLSKCADEMVKPMKDLYRDAQTAVDGVLPVVENVVKNLAECFKTNSFNILKIANCANEARKQLPTITDMGNFVKNLQKELEKINFNVDLSCIKSSLSKIQERKEELEKEISKIVEKE